MVPVEVVGAVAPPVPYIGMGLLAMILTYRSVSVTESSPKANEGCDGLTELLTPNSACEVIVPKSRVPEYVRTTLPPSSVKVIETAPAAGEIIAKPSPRRKRGVLIFIILWLRQTIADYATKAITK